MSGKEGYCEYFGLSDNLDGDIVLLVCREYGLPVPFLKTTTKLPFCIKMWINGHLVIPDCGINSVGYVTMLTKEQYEDLLFYVELKK